MEYHRIKQKYQSHIYQFNDGSLKDSDNRRAEGEDRAQGGGGGLGGSGKKTKSLSPVRVD